MVEVTETKAEETKEEEKEVPEALEEAKEEEPAPKKKHSKAQCPICFRWYASSVLRRKDKKGHVCKPPVPPPPDISAAPDISDVAQMSQPPPPPPPPPSPADMPPELPTHEQVLRWASHERETRRDRKKARWEQQMFG